MHEKIGNNLGILVVLFTLVSQFGYGQKPMVALTVDQKELAPGESCTFTVTSNMEGTVKIDFPVEFDVDYNVMHGMEQKMDASGKIKTFYYMQQSGMFKKEGTYSFYAFISYRNKTYKSNKITIKVDEDLEEESIKVRTQDPVFGIIQCKKTSIYEGEPVLLKAKVFSYMNIEYLENYNPFSGDANVETHEFTNGRVEVEGTKVNGKDALSFEYGKQLFFPIATGKCKIQPYEMALRCRGSIFSKTIRFRSSSLTLHVKSLPANSPSDFIGAVGNFDLAQKVLLSKVKEGEVFTLELTVSGVGNLHNTNPPKLLLPKGCSLYGDPERLEDFDYTEEGVRGKIVYRYNIQVLEGKNLKIAAPSISFFDPEREKYITVKGESFDIEVIPNSSFNPIASNPSDSNKHEDSKLTSQLPTNSGNGKQNAKTNWLFVIGAPAGGLLSLFLVLLLVRRRKNEPSDPVPVELNALPVHFLANENESAAVTADYWAEAEAAQVDPSTFAVVFPKAIIQRVERLERCVFQSREKAFENLTAKNKEIASQLKELIQACDHYRYGFGANELNTNELLQQAERLFSEIKSC